MNRILLPLLALLSALTPLLFDSALKGVALLALAAFCALALWRASAASRHLVWLVAVLALLIVPLLSIALPQWRVLPKWAASPAVTTPAAALTDRADPPDRPNEPRTALRLPVPPETADAPLESSIALPPPPTADSENAEPRIADFARPTWREWPPLAWAAGFTLIALRLLAAHVLLRHAARRCAIVADTVAPPPTSQDRAATPPRHGTSGDEALTATLATARAQLGIRQRVTLLIDEKRTIPVVWGVFRPRLLLPAEAREWTAEQLRSVLLHELAHVKRRDALTQWLTQIACALHWWNPLVWLAAWRLHVERERACDDLVLASGVRPSAYACPCPGRSTRRIHQFFDSDPLRRIMIATMSRNRA